MRSLGLIALLCVGVVPAALPGAGPARAMQLAQAAQKPAAAPLSPRDTYAAMTLAERTAIQSDLVWTGDYAGIIDGDFGNRSLAAVRSFQKRNKGAETGILNPHERAQLAALSKARQDQAGWRMVDDSITGVRMGLPAKLVPQAGRGKDGARWASKEGDIEVQTFRFSGPAVTLASVAAQLRAAAERKVDYDVQRTEFFVLTGSQGAKKFYIRAHAQDHEVRGFTVLYDAEKDELMQPITVAVSNAFAPFTGKGTIQVGGPVARRKVEYTTGLIVSTAGDILADRQATEGCRVIQLPQIGPAERLAADNASGLALLRVYGATGLRPAALAGDAAAGNTVTLVGIADPSVQGGGGAITTPSARVSGSATDAERTLDPAPPLGFSGAVALDQRGRIRGIVLSKPPVVAGPVTTDTQAVLVPTDVVRKFLQARAIAPATGSATAKEIRASVVRVICIRS